MARIPYPDDPTKLPPTASELLQQAYLDIFSMWAHSASTIGLIMNLGSGTFDPSVHCLPSQTRRLLISRRPPCEH